MADEYPTRNAAEVINDMGITHLHLTPALASHLTPAQIPSVQCLLTGAPLTRKVHRDWAGKGLYQGISTSQCSTLKLTIGTGFDLLGLHSPCTLGSIDSSTPPTSIGRPLGGTSVMIMTGQKDLRLLPRGALGELCFGGNQMVSSAGLFA